MQRDENEGHRRSAGHLASPTEPGRRTGTDQVSKAKARPEGDRKRAARGRGHGESVGKSRQRLRDGRGHDRNRDLPPAAGEDRKVAVPCGAALSSCGPEIS